MNSYDKQAYRELRERCVDKVVEIDGCNSASDVVAKADILFHYIKSGFDRPDTDTVHVNIPIRPADGGAMDILREASRIGGVAFSKEKSAPIEYSDPRH